MTALDFENVTMTFGRGPTTCVALDGANLAVESGEFVCIMGPSGSGKTTLLNLAAGLCQPTCGRIQLLGKDLGNLRQPALARLRSRQVGFVFQTLNLLPAMTAWQNVELPLVVNSRPAQVRADRVQQLLCLAGLADKARAYPDALSNGQRQQVAVLRAVAHQPAVVFMDEPTSSLDSERASTLLDLIVELNRSEGTTFVLTTHDPIIAQRGSRRVYIKDGMLVHPNSLLRACLPADEPTRH